VKLDSVAENSARALKAHPLPSPRKIKTLFKALAVKVVDAAACGVEPGLIGARPGDHA
jgi:hypothetical protein